MSYKIRKLLLPLLLFFSVILLSGQVIAQETGQDERFEGFSGLLEALVDGSNPDVVEGDILVDMSHHVMGDFEDMRMPFGSAPEPRIDQELLGFPAFYGLFVALSLFFMGFMVKTVGAGFNAQNQISTGGAWLVSVAFLLMSLMPHPKYTHYSNGTVIGMQMYALGLGAGQYAANWAGKELSEGRTMATSLSIPPELLADSDSMLYSMMCAANKHKESPIAKYTTRDGKTGFVEQGQDFSSISGDVKRIQFGVNRQGVAGSCGQVTVDSTASLSSLYDDMYSGSDSDYIEWEKGIIEHSNKVYSSLYLSHLDRLVDFVEGANRSYFKDSYANVIKNNPHYQNTIAPEFISTHHGEANREQFGDEESMAAFDATVDLYRSTVTAFRNDFVNSLGALNAKIVEGTINQKAYLDGSATISTLPFTVQMSTRMHSYVSGHVRRTLPKTVYYTQTCNDTVSTGETQQGTSVSSSRHAYNQSVNQECESISEVNSVLAGFAPVISIIYDSSNNDQKEAFDNLSDISHQRIVCGSGKCEAEGFADKTSQQMRRMISLSLTALTDYTGLYDSLRSTDINNAAEGDMVHVHDILHNVGTAFMEFAAVTTAIHAAAATFDAGFGMIPGVGALTGAVTVVASMAMKLGWYFGALGPSLTVVIPNIVNVTYTFATMSFPIMGYSFILALTLFAVRGCFPEGQGISGQRWERQLINILGLLFYLPLVVFGYMLYEVMLPWFYLIVSFMFRNIVMVQANIVNYVIAEVVVIAWQVLITIRIVSWLASTLVFISDKVFEMIGAPFNAGSQSMSTNEALSDTKGSIDGALKRGASMGSSAASQQGKGIQTLGHASAKASTDEAKGSLQKNSK